MWAWLSFRDDCAMAQDRAGRSRGGVDGAGRLLGLPRRAALPGTGDGRVRGARPGRAARPAAPTDPVRRGRGVRPAGPPPRPHGRVRRRRRRPHRHRRRRQAHPPLGVALQAPLLLLLFG